MAAVGVAGLVLTGCAKSSGYDRENGFCKVVQEYTNEAQCQAFQEQAAALNTDGKAAFNAPNPLRRGQTVTVTLAVADTAPPPPPPPADATAAAPGDKGAPDKAERPAADAAATPPPAAANPTPPPSPAGPAAATTASASAAPPPPPAKRPEQDALKPAEVVQALPGLTREFNLSVGPYMTADLEGDVGFEVTRRSKREQRVHMGAPYPSTLWTWDIKAKHGGAHTLTIKTAVQALDQQGKLHELSTTPQAYSFTVLADFPGTVLDRAEIWVDELKEATTFVKVLTGFITAVVALLAALGIRRIRRKKP